MLESLGYDWTFTVVQSVILDNVIHTPYLSYFLLFDSKFFKQKSLSDC